MAGRINKHLRLFVGNLPWTASRRELREYFQKYGPVKHAAVLFNKDTGMSRGYGFVQFGSRDAFMSAVSQTSHTIDNTKVVVASAEKGRVVNKSAEHDQDGS